jgi:hypothetical protein
MAENEYNLTIDRQIKKRFNRGMELVGTFQD